MEVSPKILPRADCDTDHQKLVAIFKIKLQQVMKGARPIRLGSTLKWKNKFKMPTEVQGNMTPNKTGYINRKYPQLISTFITL